MNDDLISREALKKSMRKSINERYISWTKTITVADIATLIFDEIEYAPTVCNDNYSMGYQDGVKKVLSERPIGKWLYGNLDHSTCSNCTYHNHYGDLPFCPNCGADMRKETEKCLDHL